MKAVYAHGDEWRAQSGPVALPTREDTLFDFQRYHGGALVLYALRQKIGADKFQRIERAYVDRFKDRSVSTDDYIALAAQVANDNPSSRSCATGSTAPRRRRCPATPTGPSTRSTPRRRRPRSPRRRRARTSASNRTRRPRVVGGMAAVDRSSPMPVYFQIALDLRRRIGAGEWRPGERIAPELQLVRDYAVSRVTVRQALAELVKDDLVERHRGSGTYVREQQHPLVYDLNLTVGVMATRLREAGLDNRATVVDARVLDDPPQELKLRLQIPAGGSVVHLVRVILINEEPTAVYRSWFDAARVPGLEHVDGLDGSLSAVLTEQYGLVPARGDNSLEVVRFTREDAELLKSAHDVPLLW